jgi:hypothetical protein
MDHMDHMQHMEHLTSDVTYIGFHKIDCKHRTYQVLVRPDIAEETLLSLADQVCVCGYRYRYGYRWE